MLRGREGQHGVETTVRGVPMHRRPAVQRDPQAAVGIDGHAIRQPGGGRDVHHTPPVPQPPGLGVVVEGVHALRGRVDVVQGGPVGGPRQPVRNRHAVPQLRYREIRAQPVHRAGPRGQVVGHRAGQEPAGRIALALVEPGSRPGVLDDRDLVEPPPTRVEQREAVFDGEDETAAVGAGRPTRPACPPGRRRHRRSPGRTGARARAGCPPTPDAAAPHPTPAPRRGWRGRRRRRQAAGRLASRLLSRG